MMNYTGILDCQNLTVNQRGIFMSINYIPDEIADYLKDIDPEKIYGVKAFCDLYGNTGDGYVFIADNQLYLFSKEYASEMIHISTDINESVTLSVRDEQFSLFLDIQIDGQELSCRFSSMERDALHKLCALCNATKEESVCVAGFANEDSEPDNAAGNNMTAPAGDVPITDGDSQHEIEMTIKDAFAAALLFAGCSDGELSDQEQSFIHGICSEESVRKGVEFYENYSFDVLLNLLKDITDAQKHCFLANMIELTMLDEVIHRSENKIFNSFSHAMGIDVDTHSAIYDVLMVKNNFSVFHSTK